MPIKVKGIEIIDDDRNIKNADGSQITGIVTSVQGTGRFIISQPTGNVTVSYPSTSFWVQDSVGINTSDYVGLSLSAFYGCNTDTQTLYLPEFQFSGDSVRIGSSAGSTNFLGYGSSNVYIGRNSGQNTTGSGNVFVGDFSGTNSTGSQNVFVGFCAGKTSIGSSSVFLGMNAGEFNKSNSNIFIGDCSGYLNASNSNSNIAIGSSTGRNNTGSNNILIGESSGCSNNGESNVLVGNCVGRCNKGFGNVAFGNRSFSLTSVNGSHNVFFGECSGSSNTGSYNVFLGRRSGSLNADGENNVFIGHYSGHCNSSGSRNVYLGSYSGCNSITNSDNTFIGNCSGFLNDRSKNIYVGTCSGQCITTGTDNIFIGYQSGWCAKASSNDIIIGSCAGCRYTTGNSNIFIGFRSGAGNFVSSPTKSRQHYRNIFIGKYAGYDDDPTGNETICDNIIIGAQRFGSSINGYCSNIDISYSILDTTGQQVCRNVLIDARGQDSQVENVYISSGYDAYTSCYNTSIGYAHQSTGLCGAFPFVSVVDSPLNTSCCHVGLGIRSLSGTQNKNNILIGYAAGVPLNDYSCVYESGSFFASTCGDPGNKYPKGSNPFGSTFRDCNSDGSCDCYTHTCSNIIGLGNDHTTNFYTKMACKTHAYTQVKWQEFICEIGADSSSRRFKTNIRPFLGGIKETLQLSPVVYNAIEEPNGRDQIGFIAEEVNETDVKEFVIHNENGEPLAISYDKMVALLTNTIKELNKENEDMMSQIEELESIVNNHI
jgi:hypothetical protein